MKHQRPIAHSAGFSLIEIMVSLTILAVVMSALANSQVLSLRSTAKSEWQSTAKADAIKAIEDLAGKVLLVETIDGVLVYHYAGYRSTCSTDPTNALCLGKTGNISWQVTVESGLQAEGVLLLNVTAHGRNNDEFSLVQRVSCYDIYPSPTKDTPQPCPDVAVATGSTS